MNGQNELQVFNFEKRQGRILIVDGEPWFVAKDVAGALGYSASSTPAQLFQAVPDEWKGINRIATLGGDQDMLCVSEQGLYFFLARSDKPAALPFQKKIAGEILPSIRKHGAYMTPDALERARNGQWFTLDEENQMMVFSLGENKHVRVAYSVGRVWYAAFDIARILGYKDHSKAIQSVECEIRKLPVPQVSTKKYGLTACNCITKESVYVFINQKRAEPGIRDWIRNVVIPQAERQFADAGLKGLNPAPAQASMPEPKPHQVAAKNAEILDKIDQFIMAAVALRRELQYK